MGSGKVLTKGFATSLVLAISFLSAACTHTLEQPVHDIDLRTTTNKIDLPVRLVITEDLRNAEWRKGIMGDTWIVPLGENLVRDAKQLTRNVFLNPIIPNGISSGSGIERASYTLTPKLAFAKQSMGVTAFSEAKTSLGLEWSLADENDRSVWVETFSGVGVGTTGNIFTGAKHQRLRLKAALQDVFSRSQEAMLSSTTLRSLH